MGAREVVAHQVCLVLKYIYNKKDKESRMKVAIREGYTEAFKVQIVREVEDGKITRVEANRRYGILGHSTILKWCRKYGRLRFTRKRGTEKMVMEEKDIELLQLQNEVRELKRELEAARIKNVVLETLVDVAERELQIPIRKKYGAKRSGR
jgi:transposase-like protein